MTATPRRDARSTAWQFVAPSGAAELLALADPDDCPEGAVAIAGGELVRHLRPRGWAAVAAPDLTATAEVAGCVDAAALLELLAHQVAPGGWLLCGVANAWYPGRRRAGALTLSRVRRCVHRAGLSIDAVYVALPDHHHPAVLAAAHPPGALDQALYRLPTTYVRSGARRSRIRRHVRVLMAAAAGVAPHALRLRFAPGYLVLARSLT
jgi:hypothetical protein